MSTCEKCWSDAYIISTKCYYNHSDTYITLLLERFENPCTAEEQAGQYATECSYCKKLTIHQHTNICVICGNFNPK